MVYQPTRSEDAPWSSRLRPICSADIVSKALLMSRKTPTESRLRKSWRSKKVNRSRESGLRAAVLPEPMLPSVDRERVDCYVHSPAADPFQPLEEVVGKGDGAKGIGGVVVLLPGFGKKDNCGLSPGAWGVVEKNGGFVNISKGMEDVGGKVRKDFRPEMIRARRFLIFKGRQHPTDKVWVDPVVVHGIELGNCDRGMGVVRLRGGLGFGEVVVKKNRGRLRPRSGVGAVWFGERGNWVALRFLEDA